MQCSIIPHICHGRHGRRLCKFFLAGVNFYRFNAKNWQITVWIGNLLCKLAYYCVNFGVNFILQKFCLCKKNDKYQVCVNPIKIHQNGVLIQFNLCIMINASWIIELIQPTDAGAQLDTHRSTWKSLSNTLIKICCGVSCSSISRWLYEESDKYI